MVADDFHSDCSMKGVTLADMDNLEKVNVFKQSEIVDYYSKIERDQKNKKL